MTPRDVAAVLAAVVGAAQTAAMTRTIRLLPDALLLAVVGLAGEPGALHAVGAGRRLQRPLLACAADPRDREAFYALLDALAEPVAGAWDAARDAGIYLQVVVTSAKSADLLEQIGERARTARGVPPAVRRLGAHLGYLEDRRHVAGQQALIVAPEALLAHLATGQSPVDDGHLGAVLEWIKPGAGGGGSGHISDRLRRAEALPAGPRRSPQDDAERLAPALRALHDARRRSDPTQAHRAATAIAGLLMEDIARHSRLLHEAVDALDRLALPGDHSLPDLPDPIRRRSGRNGLDQLAAAEARAFRSRAAAIDKAGGRAPHLGRDAELRRLIEREAAHAAYTAAVLLGDPMEREAGVLDGRVLRIRIVTTAAAAARPGAPAEQVDTLAGTVTGAAAPEPGQVWREVAPGSPEWTVVDVGFAADGTPTVALVRPAVAASLHLVAGAEVDLVREIPAWHGAGGRLHAAWKRTRLPLPAHLRPTAPGGASAPPAPARTASTPHDDSGGNT